MSDGNEVREFFDRLQELSTALVLLDAGDPGSYQEVLVILEQLRSDPFSEGRQGVDARLRRIQERIEECIFNPELYPERLAETEEDLKKLQRSCSEHEEPVEVDSDCQDERHETGEKEGKNESSLSSEPAPQPKQESPISLLTTEADRELYEDFLTEAGENLESIETKIISLEQDPHNLSVINEIFRPFHTIKGVSGFLNLHEINRLSHATEDLIDEAREGRITMGNREIDRVLDAVDLMRRLLASVRCGLEGNPQEELSGELDALLKRLERGEEDSQGTEKSEPAAARTMEGMGSTAETETLGEGIEDSGDEKQGDTEQERAGVCETEVPVPAGLRPSVDRRVQPEKIKTTGPATVKVDMHKLDNLVNMVGELVIAQSLIQQNDRIRSIKDQKLARDFGLLSRITSELRDTTVVMRMVPIRQTFQKMHRLVRDLTKKSGKSVQLMMSGEETEIDRNMVDAVYEPFVHMVRNAVDHGIESPEERRKAGKPETGTLSFRSYHKAGNVVIEIEDDGKGLDRDRILSKAVEKGLVLPDEKLSDHEIHQLIFRPGFSTAETITDVSGRGVGMDVVRNAIEGLRGRIDIISQAGRGSRFVMKLPLTLAIIDGMVVRVSGERYILPTLNVKEAIRPRREDCFTVEGRGEMIRIRGNLFPLIRLHEVFGLKTDANRPWEALVILAEYQDEKRCLLVDEVLEKQEVVVKSLGRGIQQPEGIAGGCIHGDGAVGLILDLNGVFRLGHGTGSQALSSRAA